MPIPKFNIKPGSKKTNFTSKFPAKEIKSGNDLKISAAKKKALYKVLNFVTKNCSQSLKAMRSAGKLLYRGSYLSPDNFFLGRPYDDRIPKDTDLYVQSAVDSYLKMCGYKALRGNSIFTSGSAAQASCYGDLCAIFPVNGFSFTWRTNEDDWVPDIHDVMPKEYDKLKDIIETCMNQLEHKINNLVTSEYIIKKASNIYNNQIEPLLIRCSATDYEYDSDENMIDNIIKDTANWKKGFQLYDNLIKEFPKLKIMTPLKRRKIDDMLKFNFKDISKNFCIKNKFSKTDFDKAIKSENEIYITGYYVAIKLSYDNYYDSDDNLLTIKMLENLLKIK